MTTADTATYLRNTAEIIQRRAISVPHGRWKWIVADNPARWQLVTNDTLVDIATCTENPDFPPSMAEHIASWDPDVALEVAAWLETTADCWEHGNSPGPRFVDAALAVARTYNRQVTP